MGVKRMTMKTIDEAQGPGHMTEVLSEKLQEAVREAVVSICGLIVKSCTVRF